MVSRCLLLLLFLFPTQSWAFFSMMARVFLGKPRKPYTGVSRHYESLREACALTPACAVFEKGAEVDCVLRCLSPTCWAREYYFFPLEPGEIDAPLRKKRYNSCLIAQEGVLRSSGLWPPRIVEATGQVLEKVERVNEFET